MSNATNKKLYVIVDSLLGPGLKIAQGGHALCAFEAAHPETYRDWHETSNNLVCLQTTHPELEKLAESLEAEGFKVARFHEPDLDDGLTAIAVEPRAWKKLSNLRLAGWTERVRVVKEKVQAPLPSFWSYLRQRLACAA